MLTENQINLLPERIAQRLQRINTEYLESIGGVLKKIGELRPSDVHKLQQLYNYGADLQRITYKLAEVSGKNVQDIYDIFDIVAKENYNYSKPFYKAAGKTFIPYEDNEELQRYVQSLAKQTAGEYVNLTQHTAFAVFDKTGKHIAPLYEADKIKAATTLSDTYTQIVDYAVTKAQLGGDGYQKVVQDVCRAMAHSGIKTVDYATGYKRRLESAVRQNVLWGIKQCNQNTADMIGEDFGADGYEISYHSNPRPSHADMAGKIYAIGRARTVNGVYYPSFSDVAHLLEEYGCLHFKFSVLLGISEPAYTREQLEELKAQDNQTFDFEGETYTRQKGKEMQNRLETAIVRQKELANMAKEAGDDDLRREAQGKINLLTSKYAKLSEASGLPTKMERMQVAGFSSVKTEIDKLAKVSEDWSAAFPVVHSPDELLEVVEYAKKRGIKISNIAEFDGEIDLLKEQIEIVAGLCNEYHLTEKIKFVFDDLTDGDYAVYDNGGIIRFNKKVLRNREITNKNLNQDKILSSTNTDGIATHEMWHAISSQYRLKGIDIAKEAYYNIYGSRISTIEMIDYLESNVSLYASKAKKSKRHTEYREIIPEVMAQNATNATEFSKEFMRIIKELVK